MSSQTPSLEKKPPLQKEAAPSPSPPPPHSQWWIKEGIRTAVILGALSIAYTTYQRLGSHSSSSIGLAKLPESYALCAAESGKVYTVEETLSNVDCVLVVRDRVLGTGTLDEVGLVWDAYQNETIKKFYGNEPTAKKPMTVLATSPGSIIVPGLADAHAHLIDYGFKVQLPLDRAQSLTDVLDILEAYVKSHPDIETDHDQWIRGMGWDQTRWKDWDGGFPTAEHLALRPSLATRPIALSRVDGHALWISPRAIKLTKDSLPNQTWPSDDEIEGGEIQRDEDGNPAGVFVDLAMDLVPTPPYSEQQMEDYAIRAFGDALSVGLTSVHDASSMQSETVDVYKRLADEGKLSIRVYAMASPDTPADERLEGYGVGGRLDMKSVKIFTDGALGSWGAALLEPYSDNPSTSGLMRTSESKLEGIVQRAWNNGWGVNIHCIGDRANKAVLDIYERILTKSSNDPLAVSKERRPRIEHAQIMRMEDLKRSGALGVITSVQPTHATSDMWYAEKRLGPERIKGAYAYQTLLQYTSENLTRAQALKGITLDAAYAAFAEEDFGSLEPGKKADFVILSQDLMDEGVVPISEILRTQVLATVLDGRIAFGRI
ncbi:hypothetical protein EUX98_g931 [Antrodiella citrinella]|uniref:Amidohydrolase 3 domain-containing protein n=1 Tax=Antrodiella citrinella TaxID=2447956 RepID=A0A4S4N5W7_9APHY|nr:hypothetical protein EUX98_g931 [Antrodiella citrinella]